MGNELRWSIKGNIMNKHGSLSLNLVKKVWIFYLYIIGTFATKILNVYLKKKRYPGERKLKCLKCLKIKYWTKVVVSAW